jgi:hypothetical protein
MRERLYIVVSSSYPKLSNAAMLVKSSGAEKLTTTDRKLRLN